ncbi:hypothetical protein TSOC_005816 [Tetrabaena socialis]|uniref:Uncharacterized protein n=1 Tax=Tetrabaena socialis TaxID=47790 RepID=A0A2J8A574_9CHLO|nr:hypothetical protein TSOC_005816 [Tetrabaena socialis]|eukprot:PNH07674.1 hypothetical protein TSOC_005816 [Tetrabaena socialis]
MRPAAAEGAPPGNRSSSSPPPADPRVTATSQPAADGPHGRLDDLRALLLRRGPPELRDAIQSLPGFSQLLGVQGEVLRRVAAALGVRPARMKHTDGEGVLALQSLQPGAAAILLRSYRTPPAAAAAAAAAVAPEPAAPTAAAAPQPAAAPAAAAAASLPAPPPLHSMAQSVACYSMPDEPVRVVLTTTVSPPDDWPTPQLDIEVGGTEESLVFYAGMSPRSALSTDLPYLHRYYVQPPHAVQHTPAVQPQQQDDGEPHVSSSSGKGGDTGGRSGGGLPSFKQLEAEARKEQGFTPFVSRSLWVRAIAAGALCFAVPWQGGQDPQAMEAVRRYTTTLTDIWLAHLLADARIYAGSGEPALDGGPDASGQRARWRQASEVLRNYVRHDPVTSLLYPVYGERQVLQIIETVAGEEAV